MEYQEREELEILIQNLKAISMLVPACSDTLVAAARKMEEMAATINRLCEEVTCLEEELDEINKQIEIEEECDGRCFSCDLFDTSYCPDSH